jgi:hypothetical protein
MLPSTSIRTPRKSYASGRVQRYRMLATGAALLGLAFFLGTLYGRSGSSASTATTALPDAAQRAATAAAGAAVVPTAAHTLVIYIFSKTDTEYENNLLFFLKFGVKADDGCDYIFILQEIQGVKVSLL